MCSEVCPPPRSPPFSCDLETDTAQPMIRDSGSDFEFNFHGSLGFEFKSCQTFADELFADGMILPVFHTAHNYNLTSVVTPRRSAPLPPVPNPENTKRALVPKEDGSRLCPGLEARPVSRWFWGFRRSACLSTDKKRLICSLLSRSKSTGSVPEPNQALKKQPSIKMMKSFSFSASSTSSSSFSGNDWNQKTPSSRKTSPGSWNGAYRVSPILNMPSPCIIRAGNLFGLSSFFCSGKDKKKIRR